MINYTPQNQLSLELFKHPFETELDRENRWVKLAAIIPWDRLANIYSQKLNSTAGRYSVNVRTVIAALIVKHRLNLDDRGTIQMIKENIYLQYFCGLSSFTTKAVFDPSLFVDIRKRLGTKEFEKFNRIIIEESESMKPHQARIMRKRDEDERKNSSGDLDQNNEKDNQKAKDSNTNLTEKNFSKNKGTLKVDATVADQEIKFPNDVGLLNESREKTEQMIDSLYEKGLDGIKPRTYRRKARKEFLEFSKKKRKSAKLIRKAKKQQLQYLRRNLNTIEKMLNTPERKRGLTKKQQTLLEVIKAVYAQQKWMYDNRTNKHPNRIVSIHQFWVRPIVRGKDKQKTEFGSKINVSEVNGFCMINKLEWEAYNEGKYLEEQVETFKNIFGRYPKFLLGDQIYLTRDNRKYLQEKGIKIVGKPLGRPKKATPLSSSEKYRKKKKNAERNHIEGKFGQAKRGYGLNNIKARLLETSESWVNSIIFVMNLLKMLEVAEKYHYFFVRFFKRYIFGLKNFLRLILNNFQPLFQKHYPIFMEI